jgi:hypothetical protein
MAEDIASNIIKMIVNQDFSSGLEARPLLDYFPYLAPPPTSLAVLNQEAAATS